MLMSRNALTCQDVGHHYQQCPVDQSFSKHSYSTGRGKSRRWSSSRCRSNRRMLFFPLAIAKNQQAPSSPCRVPTATIALPAAQRSHDCCSVPARSCKISAGHTIARRHAKTGMSSRTSARKMHSWKYRWEKQPQPQPQQHQQQQQICSASTTSLPLFLLLFFFGGGGSSSHM